MLADINYEMLMFVQINIPSHETDCKIDISI